MKKPFLEFLAVIYLGGSVILAMALVIIILMNKIIDPPSYRPIPKESSKTTSTTEVVAAEEGIGEPKS